MYIYSEWEITTLLYAFIFIWWKKKTMYLCFYLRVPCCVCNRRIPRLFCIWFLWRGSRVDKITDTQDAFYFLPTRKKKTETILIYMDTSYNPYFWQHYSSWLYEYHITRNVFLHIHCMCLYIQTRYHDESHWMASSLRIDFLSLALNPLKYWNVFFFFKFIYSFKILYPLHKLYITI